MNNPPAFPNDAVKDPFDKAGMTLRDYFAAKAMQAFLTSNRDLSWQELGALSYDAADAMMKAREA
jgi:hypothetical protein